MPISLQNLRDELYPGLAGVMGRYRLSGWDALGQPMTETVHGLFVPQAPHIWVPKLTVPEALVVGAAAAVIQDPVVTRRFWQGWLK